MPSESIQFEHLTVNKVVVVPFEGLAAQVPFAGGKFVFRSSELNLLVSPSEYVD
jgi:hypothetical protein